RDDRSPAQHDVGRRPLAKPGGEPLTRVFTVLHEATREPVETSAERCLDEDRAMGVTSHLLLSAATPRSAPSTGLRRRGTTATDVLPASLSSFAIRHLSASSPASSRIRPLTIRSRD